MAERATEVLGLPLPEALALAIRDGLWTRLQESAKIAEVFDDEPDNPMFYDIETMTRQNRALHTPTAAAELLADHPLAGEGLGIDPALTLLIGDLGADMPVALDYRHGRRAPRVIYLGIQGWVEVAASVDELIARLQSPS